MYHLLGNNPTLLDEPFETIEKVSRIQMFLFYAVTFISPRSWDLKPSLFVPWKLNLFTDFKS